MSKRLFRVVAEKPFDFAKPDVYRTAATLTKVPVNYIGGQWVAAGADGAGTLAVVDPCTNTHIGDVPRFGRAEAEAAIATAQTAFESWRGVMPRERAVIVRRWADLMLTHKEALGSILSRESGKVLGEGVGEVVYAERFVEWYAGEAERIYGDIIPGPRPTVQTTVIKEPVGVVGIVTPWNFPAAMITRAAAGAIAAGCSVVVKPASATPFTALALAQTAEEAGVPPGVFNVVTGDSGAISGAMLDSFDVRKIAFTGSTEVGKGLYRGCADTVKKVSMELGGNAPLIVFEDADIARAVDGLIAAKFRNAGQTCICCNRALVHSSIFEAFKTALVAKVSALKVGNAFAPGVHVGAMIHADSVEAMKRLVADAVAKGATVECGGEAVPSQGFFFQPTVLSGVRHDTMRCCQEEIFGPVLPLVAFDSEEEAVTLANTTRAGLASYFYTNDYRRQFRVSRALRFGMVGCNDTALSAPCAPFGGIKESGLGRDGSKYGIEAFVDIKYVMLSTV